MTLDDLLALARKVRDGYSDDRPEHHLLRTGEEG